MVLLNASTPIDPSDLLRNRRMQELHDKFFPTKKTQTKSEDRSTDVQTNVKNVFDMMVSGHLNVLPSIHIPSFLSPDILSHCESMLSQSSKKIHLKISSTRIAEQALKILV